MKSFLSKIWMEWVFNNGNRRLIAKMDEFWKKKIDEVVGISKEMGYEELNKEFWMNKPAVLTSFVIDICKSHVKVLDKVMERLEQILKESKKNERRN